MKFKDLVFELAETLISTLLIIYVLYTFVAVPELVWGASMEPTFESGERILVEKITKHYKPFERGEIVVLNPPTNENVDYIKRIVAVPGDIVKILECKVYISRDGSKFLLDEYYLSDSVCTKAGTYLQEGRSFKLGADEYIVMGDNRSNSADSRFFGPIMSDSVVGRVIFVFWPFSQVGFVNK